MVFSSMDENCHTCGATGEAFGFVWEPPDIYVCQECGKCVCSDCSSRELFTKDIVCTDCEDNIEII